MRARRSAGRRRRGGEASATFNSEARLNGSESEEAESVNMKGEGLTPRSSHTVYDAKLMFKEHRRVEQRGRGVGNRTELLNLKLKPLSSTLNQNQFLFFWISSTLTKAGFVRDCKSCS